MKKQLLFIAFLLCACLAGGCKDDDPSAPDSLYMYSTSGTVEAVAGTQSVTIYTTCGVVFEAGTYSETYTLTQKAQ